MGAALIAGEGAAGAGGEPQPMSPAIRQLGQLRKRRGMSNVIHRFVTRPKFGLATASVGGLPQRLT